jgi:MFS family permease
MRYETGRKETGRKITRTPWTTTHVRPIACQGAIMVALLVALGIDNVGSGLFLPLTLVYATRVVGLPLAVAGVTVTLGTVVGLLVPPLAGRLVDRVGPRPVVIASQVLQACGAALFGVADGVAGVIAATCALAAGQQLFYSSLFALIADVVGDKEKDLPFAVVGMVRSACFGLGGLAAAGLLTLGALRVAVWLDAASFVACGVLLAVRVRAPHVPAEPGCRDGSSPTSASSASWRCPWTSSSPACPSSCSTRWPARRGCPARSSPCTRCSPARAAPSPYGRPAASRGPRPSRSAHCWWSSGAASP